MWTTVQCWDENIYVIESAFSAPVTYATLSIFMMSVQIASLAADFIIYDSYTCLRNLCRRYHLLT